MNSGVFTKSAVFIATILGVSQCIKAPKLKSEEPRFPSRSLQIQTSHHFPLTPSSPSKMLLVNAFPNLSFQRPMFLLSPPDQSNRIFVVEQNGTIVVFPNQPQAENKTLFLDIRDLVARDHEEEGLLGMAFDPNYKNNGYFYLNYTAADPLRTVIVRYHVSTDPNIADSQSAHLIMEIPQPYANHNGGMLAFGPEGMLYIGMGDGGSGGDPQGNGQKKNTLLGKMLRIDPKRGSNGLPYSIPQDNPFVNEVLATRPEIWAYGLRNPWRFSFDRNTGKLWAGDVGQNKYEEIDIIEKGGNYGWNPCEGFHRYGQSGNCPSTFKAPIFEYDHQVGPCIIGGYVYRGRKLNSLRGAYLYGDNVTKQIWGLVYNESQVASNTLLGTLPMPLSSFGEDEQGEVYALGLKENGAKIYRFEEAPNQPPLPPFPTKLSETGLFIDTVKLLPDPSLVPYSVNLPLWSDGAEKFRWMSLPTGGKIEFSAKGPWKFPVGTAFVKHFEIKLGPKKIRRLETRVLLHEENGWAGYTYQWNDTQTEAHLLLNAETQTYSIEEDPKSHRTTTVTWAYPSRTDCLRCHTAPSGFILGAVTRQLNHSNLLKDWNQKKLFTTDLGTQLKYDAYPSLKNKEIPIATRARAYLAVNCAHCHQPEGGTPTRLDLNFDIAIEETHALGVTPGSGTLEIPNAKIIAQGKKEQSVLWERMRRRGAMQMPPIASSLSDAEALSVIGAWIDGL